MTASLNSNRSMFWRIIRRLLLAHRGRLFVVLLGLGAGAAVTAALLNLQVDAKRRLTTEFRTLGPNVVIGPRNSSDSPTFLNEVLFGRVPDQNRFGSIAKAEFLYGIIDVSVTKIGDEDPDKAPAIPAIVVGYGHSDFGAKRVLPPALIDAEEIWKSANSLQCGVGPKVASTLKLVPGDGLWLRNGPRRSSCGATMLPSTGGPEDSQIFFEDLLALQTLLEQPQRISLIQLSVPGTSGQIEQFVDELQPQLGDAEGRPVRQFTEAQAKIYNRISGLLNFTVGIVLVLTALCVMAAMTNVAMERRNDVGLMKAIGGAKRRVLRLFLTEATILGLAGGILGAAAGIALSIWLGKAVFGLAARPRLIVYPVSVLLTMIVAILSAFPLRRLANVRPASVFRGEA